MCLLCSYHECMWELWSHLGIPAWGTASATCRSICHCWQGGVAALLSVPDTCWPSTLPWWDSQAAEHTLGCHPSPWCTPDSVDGTGGAGGWVFQGDMFLATRGSTCGWHRLHAFQASLWTNWRLRGMLVWRVFILFLFVFNLGSIITHSKHSEASSRAILQLQLGLSLLYALVSLYRVNWRLKQIKYSICLHSCFPLFLRKIIYFCFFTTVCWNWPTARNNCKVKMKRKSSRKQKWLQNLLKTNEYLSKE